MLKKLLTLIILISQLSFSQTEKDDYELYSLILNKRLEFGNKTEKDKIVLIEQFMDEFDGDYEVLDHKSDTITKLDLNMLYSMTYKDTTFIKRVSKERDLRNVIIQLTSDKSEHPKIESELLQKQSIEIETITDKKFSSFFGNNRRIEKGWKRIQKKYGTDKIVEFSQVNYNGQFAATYYGIHCGGLCGSGNIVVFEKINGKWKILTEINLWMA
ncbi:hypothetical protein [Maribacter dokdonensis]|uniref:hypothetical protein n=1 Tax=Maribacter dokdonensis TaxID=320912 RepID=UPI0007199BC1|nr:hypothetical protein [Maribacter dokdonensis]